MSQLIRIDGEVFKIKDQKVDALRTGKVSTYGFALLLTPDDPFMLIGDTVYVLTPSEFYSLQSTYPDVMMSEVMFDHILGLKDISFMSEKDQAFVEEVRKGLETCSSCQYKRYKNEVYKLSKKYGIKPTAEEEESIKNDFKWKWYPQTTDRIVPKVFARIQHTYKFPKAERVSCMNCVEKHLAQAYITGMECLQGYPEYLALVVGHLAEAYDELPAEFRELKQSIELCMAKTNMDREPFVPIRLFSSMIQLMRNNTSTGVYVDNNDVNPNSTLFNIDITDDVRKEIDRTEDSVLKELAYNCKAADNFALGVEKLEDVMSWEGAMACAADKIAVFMPKTANMIRNRRLLFVTNPALSLEAGYGLKDIAEAIQKRQIQ